MSDKRGLTDDFNYFCGNKLMQLSHSIFRVAKDIAKASNDVTKYAKEVATQCTDKRIKNDMMKVTTMMHFIFGSKNDMIELDHGIRVLPNSV